MTGWYYPKGKDEAFDVWGSTFLRAARRISGSYGIDSQGQGYQYEVGIIRDTVWCPLPLLAQVSSLCHCLALSSI